MRRRSYLTTTVATMGIGGCFGNVDDDTGVAPDEHGSDRVKKMSAGVLDDFEDLSRWTVGRGEISTISNHTENGSQSCQITASETEPRARITVNFSEPVDCSDVVPGLLCRAPKTIYPRIQFFDSSGGRVDFRSAVVGGIPFHRPSFGIEDVTADVDLTRIDQVQISLWVGDDDSGTIIVDELFLVPRPDTGKVLIQFDDGYETDYTKAFPILERYEYPATTFVNPEYVGTERSLSLEQIHKLDAAGWCVSSHAYEHSRLAKQNKQEQEAQIRDAKDWLLERGFERGADYFAYPFSSFNQQTLELVDKYHSLGFAAGWPANGHISDRTLCPRVGDPSFDQARAILERTAEYRGISTLFYHDLNDEDLTEFESTISHLYELESENELDVILPSELEREFAYSK